MEEDLPVSLPREKEKQALFSNIDFKWIVAMIITTIMFLWMYSNGAFSNVPKNTWYVMGGLIVGLGYLLFSKIKPKQPIGMKMARKIAKAWIFDLQKEGEVPYGIVKVPVQWKKLKNRGKITDYIGETQIKTSGGKTLSIIVGVDAYTGDCGKLKGKIGGVLDIDEEAKDVAPMPVVIKRGQTPETVYTEEEGD